MILSRSRGSSQYLLKTLPLETFGSYSIVCDVGVGGKRGSGSAWQRVSPSPRVTYSHVLSQLRGANLMSVTKFQRCSVCMSSALKSDLSSPRETSRVRGKVPETPGRRAGRSTAVARHACRCQRRPARRCATRVLAPGKSGDMLFPGLIPRTWWPRLMALGKRQCPSTCPQS